MWRYEGNVFKPFHLCHSPFLCCFEHLNQFNDCSWVLRQWVASVLVSVPKDARGDLLVSDNYRGIALCSALSKVIDYIILERHSDDPKTAHLQFAYKKEHSTTMYTAVIKEVFSTLKNRMDLLYMVVYLMLQNHLITSIMGNCSAFCVTGTCLV